MEVREVSTRVKLSNINIYIANGMCPVHNEHNPFFLEEGLKSIYGEDDAGHGTDVINHYHLDLLWVAIHELLHSQLDALRSLKIFGRQCHLHISTLTSTMVTP